MWHPPRRGLWWSGPGTGLVGVGFPDLVGQGVEFEVSEGTQVGDDSATLDYGVHLSDFEVGDALAPSCEPSTVELRVVLGANQHPVSGVLELGVAPPGIHQGGVDGVPLKLGLGQKAEHGAVWACSVGEVEGWVWHDSSPWECGVWLGLGVEAYNAFGAGVVVGPLGLATESEGSVLTESTDVCDIGRVGAEGEALGLDLGCGFSDGFEFCGSGWLPSIHGRFRGVAVGVVYRSASMRPCSKLACHTSSEMSKAAASWGKSG